MKYPNESYTGSSTNSIGIKIDKQPEVIELLEGILIELNSLTDLRYSINNAVNRISDFTSKSPVGSNNEVKEVVTVIEKLHFIKSRLISENNAFNNIRTNLDSLV